MLPRLAYISRSLKQLDNNLNPVSVYDEHGNADHALEIYSLQKLWQLGHFRKCSVVSASAADENILRHLAREYVAINEFPTTTSDSSPVLTTTEGKSSRVRSPLQAEALAIRSGLLNAKSIGFSKICIQTDCQALLQTISTFPPLRLNSVESNQDFRGLTDSTGSSSIHP
ncbi:hypothetical protein Bca4012_054232 [Brassica carinata]|uniref:RNase H type-1 domain-containing protein n=1 Tax=Brassica carinata TaxID=52824 RepID=A0A8X7VXM2_BRACI|nr:hypothetical protein Bca52824_012744 [Brassica carinata]